MSEAVVSDSTNLIGFEILLHRGICMKIFSTLSLVLFVALTFGTAVESAAQKNPLAKTVWIIESLGAADDQQPVETISEADDQFPTIVFEDKGFRGYIAGCNTISFSYAVQKKRLSIKTKTSTMKACPDYLGKQDREISSALGKSKSFKISGENLEIYYANGKIMRLKRSIQ